MREEYAVDRHQLGLRRALDVLISECSQTDYLLNQDMQKAIKAYLDASGMVMVPRVPTVDMINAAVESPVPVSYAEAGWCYNEMITAATNPFQTPEESREKK